MSYTVKLEVFEGPFDLLFHLIEKNEVDIYNIPIAEITAQYLRYLDEMHYFDIEVASEFLVMAATLIQIKSKMLLPNQSEEEDDGIDPRQQLVDRLVEYRKYKNITEELQKREYQYQKRIFKEPEPQVEYVESEPMFINLDIMDLCRAFNKVITKYKDMYNDRSDLMKSVEREEVSVTDKIRFITDKLKRKDEIEFDHLFTQNTTKTDVVVTFIAMLELIRLKKVIVEQTQICGRIVIRKRVFKGWR